MPICPDCKGQVQPDAVFCEHCGWKMDSPPPPGPGEAGADRPAAPGWLRAEIPLLTGGARQIRAMVENARERAERDRQAQKREQELRRQEQQEGRKGRAGTFAAFMVGLCLLALWIWLLVRGIRGTPPQHVLQLLSRFPLPGTGPLDSTEAGLGEP